MPWMEGWREGLGPTKPVLKDGRLYGRGGADDGYAPFACMLAIKNLQLQGTEMPRCVLVLETEEESGSPNLINLLTVAKDFVGKPDACICMDSGAFDYENLWVTSSLRGIMAVELTIQAGAQGYHSGELGGIMPETFRVLRELLSRVEKEGIVCEDLQTNIPTWAKKEAEVMAKVGGSGLYKGYKLNKGVKYLNQSNLKEMYLANTWKPTLSVIGADGIPNLGIAGNVIR